MNPPDERNGELADALADLEAAAEHVASLAKGIRRDLDGPGAGAGAMPGSGHPPQGPRPGPPPGPPQGTRHGPPTHQPPPLQSRPPGPPMPPGPPPPPPQLPPAPPAPATRVPLAPAEPWWSNEKTVLKITAAIGALITIAGVILLVALAIQSGLLGPLGRVILAYSLAAALAVTAVVVQRKNPDNAGVAAAAAASVITAHITTTVLVQGLEWWPNWLGTLVVLAVMSLGFAAARLWGSVALHVVVLFVSFIAASLTTVAVPGATGGGSADITVAVVLPPIAAAWMWLGMPKRPVVAIFAVILFLFGSVRVLVDAEPEWLAMATFIVAGIALALPEFLAAPEEPDGHPAGPAPMHFAAASPLGAAPGGISAPPRRSSVDHAPLHLLAWLAAPMTSVFGQLHLTSTAIALVLGLAIGAAGFGPWLDRADPRMVALRWAGLCSAALPALHLASAEPLLSWTRMPAVLIAAAVIWFHVFRPTQIGRWLVPLWTAVALIANQPALVLTMFAPSYLREKQIWLWTLDVPDVTVSGLLIGVCALGLIAIVASRRGSATDFDKSAGLAGLLLTAVPVITVLTAAGVRFSLAHVLVSLGWMAAAAWLMLAPKRVNVDANLAASLVIAGVAVLKLVLYDMQAMSGLTRVAAFLLCGLLLLGMVVARNLRDRSTDLTAAAGAPGFGPGSRPGPGPVPHEGWGTGPSTPPTRSLDDGPPGAPGGR